MVTLIYRIVKILGVVSIFHSHIFLLVLSWFFYSWFSNWMSKKKNNKVAVMRWIPMLLVVHLDNIGDGLKDLIVNIVV